MSITDELRKYAQSWRETPNLMDELDAGDIDGLLGDIEHIADSIDAEHDKAMSRAGQLLADAEKDRAMDELSAEVERLKDELSHCIELPKDADGEYIHIGDVMSKGRDILFGKASFKVRSMLCDEFGWGVYDRFGDRYAPSLICHHHAPTVEDVLREFAERYLDYEGMPSAGRRGVGEELMDEYASKLRLADDDEEQ